MNRREELRKKLHAKIYEKKHGYSGMTQRQAHQIKKDVDKEYNDMKNDARITSEMLTLYTQALVEHPKNNIPNPKTVLDDPVKYKKEYGLFVLNIINQAKEKDWGTELVKSMLNNAYTRYITHTLELPSLPSFIQ
jgi:hypothetical protein